MQDVVTYIQVPTEGTLLLVSMWTHVSYNAKIIFFNPNRRKKEQQNDFPTSRATNVESSEANFICLSFRDWVAVWLASSSSSYLGKKV